MTERIIKVRLNEAEVDALQFALAGEILRYERKLKEVKTEDGKAAVRYALENARSAMRKLLSITYPCDL